MPTYTKPRYSFSFDLDGRCAKHGPKPKTRRQPKPFQRWTVAHGKIEYLKRPLLLDEIAELLNRHRVNP